MDAVHANPTDMPEFGTAKVQRGGPEHVRRHALRGQTGQVMIGLTVAERVLC